MSSRLRYGAVALAAFMLGSATVVTAVSIPFTRIVDRFDANKAAAVDENGNVSIIAANTDSRLDSSNALLGNIKTDADKFTFDSGNLKVSSSGTSTVSGSVSVNNLPATQPVSGSVSVNNLPATQPVSGTVNVGNFPGSQTVHVDNFPASAGAPGVANRGLFIGFINAHTNSGTPTTVPIHMVVTYMEVSGCDSQDFFFTGGGNFYVGGSGRFTFPGGVSIDHVIVSYNSILGGSCDPFTQIIGY